MRNSLNSTAHWNRENGYMHSDNQTNRAYPYRVFGCGMRDSLAAILGIALDDSSQSCTDLAQGFRVSLHSPDKLPNLPDECIHIPANQDIFISVKPIAIATSRGLRSYAPEKRGCYFQTERKLRFFRTYNQYNCEQECLANYTQTLCGCVRFFMPSTEDSFSNRCKSV